MNYYEEIKDKLIDVEVQNKVKDYSKNKYIVEKYYEIGNLLNEAGKQYGENIVGKYAQKLEKEVGKKYNKRTLFRMKQFYNVFSNQKVSPLVTQLSWTHYIILMSLNNSDEINYYMDKCINNNLSKRQLELLIKSNEYKRLPDSAKNKIILQKDTTIEDTILNPIVIKSNNKKTISEKVLHQLILEDLDNFLKQLGSGFTYVGSEYPIKLGYKYNYIDLLLYNYIYHSFVVVELKVTELKKEHIGQIQVYMNYIDSNIKSNIDNKTIGIIVSKKDNEYVIKYCSDNKIFSREYQLI